MRLISAFAGIGGFDLGAQTAGIEVVAHIEKDAHCRKLLAAKFPDAIILDDVCTAGAHNLPQCDVLCGGWPCQDLSVAGLRAGLIDGKRSNLFYELTRLIRELRPRYFIGENVPGLLSSDGGRDFARVLGELGKCGARDIAWRTLDAQWFGLAQRRNRVFIVADFGGERAEEILSLSEGLRGYPAPSRETGQGAAGGPAACLNSGGNRGGFRTEPGAHLVASIIAPPVTSNPYGDHESREGLLIAHTLRGEGFDVSEDGTGRGTPLVAVRGPQIVGALSADDGTQGMTTIQAAMSGMIFPVEAPNEGEKEGTGPSITAFDTTQITSAVNRSNPQPGDPCHTLAKGAQPPAIAFSCKDHGADAGEIAPTLRAMNHDQSHMNGGGGQVAIAIQEVDAREKGQNGIGIGKEGDPMFTLQAGAQHGVAVAFDMRGREDGAQMEGPHDTANIRASSGGSSRSYVATSAVRRLTPTECERLQGFPDGHTEGFSDSIRYRQLGNAVAVPCAAWIFKNLMK